MKITNIRIIINNLKKFSLNSFEFSKQISNDKNIIKYLIIPIDVISDIYFSLEKIIFKNNIKIKIIEKKK